MSRQTLVCYSTGALFEDQIRRSEARVLDHAGVIALAVASIVVPVIVLPYAWFTHNGYHLLKESLVHFVAGALLAATAFRVRSIAFDAMDLLLISFFIVSVVSGVAVSFNWWASWRPVALTSSGIAVYSCTKFYIRRGYIAPIEWLPVLIAVSAVVPALLEAYGAIPRWSSQGVAPGGTLGNRNLVAHVAALAFPYATFLALKHVRYHRNYAACIPVLLLAAAIVICRTRAAWLAMVVAFAIGLCGVYFRRRQVFAWRQPVLVVSLAFLIGVGWAVYAPSTLQWRSTRPLLDTASGLLNYESGTGRGRLVAYGNSLRMARDHVLLGVGPGHWHLTYPIYATIDDPTYKKGAVQPVELLPRSDWIGVLAERGVIAILVIVVIGIVILLRNVKCLRRAVDDSQSPLQIWACLSTTGALAVLGLFDAVLHTPTALLLAAVTYAIFSAADGIVLQVPSTIYAHLRAVWVLAVLIIGTIFVLRSAQQITALAVAGSGTQLDQVVRATRVDPTNYRLQVRAADGLAAIRNCLSAEARIKAARALEPYNGLVENAAQLCGL